MFQVLDNIFNRETSSLASDIRDQENGIQNNTVFMQYFLILCYTSKIWLQETPLQQYGKTTVL